MIEISSLFLILLITVNKLKFIAMDTGTVMTIIEMLDRRIELLRPHSSTVGVTAVGALEDFKDYLQEYIHSLQNQVENEMNRGE